MRINDLSHARDGGVMQVAPSTDYYSHGFYKYPVTGSGELDRTSNFVCCAVRGTRGLAIYGVAAR